MLTIIYLLIVMLLGGVEMPQPDIQAPAAQAGIPVYQQQPIYDHSLNGYYAIGTPVTFTATQLQLFGDAAGSYTGAVIGYMLTSYANQSLSNGYTVDYVVSYTANGLQRTAALPVNQVSG